MHPAALSVCFSSHMPPALLLKDAQQGVQIGGRPILVLLFLQSGEQSTHLSSFIDEATDVALWVTQANCLRDRARNLDETSGQPIIGFGLEPSRAERGHFRDQLVDFAITIEGLQFP